VIFIGAVDDGAAEVLGPGAGAGLAPHAAIDDTSDDAKPIIASLVAMLTNMILRLFGRKSAELLS
jgi:hypothetical protein